jgi:hypothetical protein
MGPQRELLDDADIEDLLADVLPDAAPQDIESFAKEFQKFGKHVAPVAQKALPGAIQGAVTGATVAGPWGAVAGAVGGGVAGAVSSRPAVASPRPAAAPTAPTRPARPVAAAASARQGTVTKARITTPVVIATAPPPAAPATAQLLTLLSRPETVHALQALLLANLGRATVQVGPRAVPAAEFANAIAETAAQAAAEAAPYLGTELPEHLLTDDGELRVDVVNPAERAALLVGDLVAIGESEAAEAEQAEGIGPSWGEADEETEETDPLDSYEGSLAGEAGDGD